MINGGNEEKNKDSFSKKLMTHEKVVLYSSTGLPNTEVVDQMLVNKKPIQEEHLRNSKIFYSSEVIEEQSIKLNNNDESRCDPDEYKDIYREEVKYKERLKSNADENHYPLRRDTFMFDGLAVNVKSVDIDPMSVFESTSGDKSQRRYNKANIEKGKLFFKLRYVKEKLAEMQEMQNNKRAQQPLVNASVESEVLKKNKNFLNEDKNAIKYSSLFLQKIEKAIFSFNLKKFEDSYIHLLSNGIVKNENEFGEFLLCVTGFDKYIIGDFLSKEKVPNKELKVLKSFMKCIDFRNVKFLDGFRFLLSRLNLPKDAILILTIIDEFSVVFFEDNKSLSIFPESNAVYLLSSSVLTLNTVISRTDIQTMNVMRKEDFVKINKTCDRNTIEGIYDELTANKLDMVHDYNELIYRRLTKYQGEGGANEKKSQRENININEPNNNNAIAKDDLNLSKNSSFFNEMKTEECLAMLKAGQMFTKYGNYGKPHLRFVKLNPDEKKITWTPVGGCNMFRGTKSIDVIDIKDVYIGASTSKIFEKYHIPYDYDHNCFSIAGSKRSLDLRGDDENVCKKWYQGIKFLIKRTKSIMELKKNNKNSLKDFLNKTEMVGDIWKTEILPNWHIYRKYVIIKGCRSLTDDIFQTNNQYNTKNKENIHQVLFFKVKRSVNSKSLEKSEFLNLWTLGIPNWLRKKMWPLVIGNETGIGENLFNFHLKKVEVLNFNELISIANQQGIKGGIDEESIKVSLNEDIILNEIIKDIIKISGKFYDKIKEQNLEMNTFVSDLFKTVRVFLHFRPDVTYSKQIVYISLILLLNSENYYTAFINLVNFVVPSFVMKFLTRDENYIRIRHEFFENLVKAYAPKLAAHFSKLDISTSLYFFKWIEYVFINTFQYNTLLRIWDILLLKGEMFLYEVALCILKIQETDLSNIPVKDVLKNLKKLPSKISEEEFFDILQEIDITEDYKRLIYENSLAVEKGLLFQSFMIEWL